MASKRKRTIVVTGASRGLGREIALAFGRYRDRVVVNYLAAEDRAKSVVNLIAETGGEAFSFKADVASEADVELLTAETLRRWGSIDVLVNNAGVTRDQVLLRMKESDWDDVFDTNLKGPFHTIRSIGKIMKDAGGGHIINISSIVGLHGREGQANYSASKAGLIGLTKACSREFGPFNVKVNAVLPGFIRTEMGAQVSNEILDRVLAQNALGRFSDSKEISEFIYHLSKMENVSGQVFNLDSRII